MAFEELTGVNSKKIYYVRREVLAAVWLSIPLWWYVLLLGWIVCSRCFEKYTVLVFSVG